MKQFFTLSFFRKGTSLPIVLCFLLMSLQSMGQITATEEFENETAASSFSESGINFTHTFNLQQNAAPYGYNGSAKFLELIQPNSNFTTTATISINNSLNPSVTFKINSFAGYISSSAAGSTPFNGAVTVSGTPIGSTTAVSATINISSASGALPAGQTRDGNGVVNGLNFTGTALDGLYFTSLTFSINDADGPGPGFGSRYFELDHMNFTTAASVTNQFSISDASITEGSGGTKSMAFTVSCTSTTAASSVQVQSSNGTATAGSDYVAFPLTTVSFAAGGPTSQTVNVTINGDMTIEPDETFNMTLSNPTGGTIFDGTAVGTILDDDNITETFEDEPAIPVSSISTVTGFSERGFNFVSNGELFVSRGNNLGAGNCGCTSTALDTRTGNGGSAGNVGSFFINIPGTSFDLKSIDVYTSNNDGTSGTTTGVFVTFTGAKADGSGSVIYTATVAPISGFNYQTVSFTGTPFANVQLLSVSVTLGSGINYIALDNIRYGTVSFSGIQLSINDVSVLEGTGGGTSTATFTVTRSGNSSSFSVNVASSDVSATAGSDYVAYNSTLNFASGGPLTQTVSVTILRDALIEGNETFNMTLSGATNGVLYQKPVGTGTILDDDKVIETFEDETNAATTFSENSVTFSTTGRFKVLYGSGSNSGSGSSKGYLSSSPTNPSPNTGGSQGKISVTSLNTAFKLLQLDGWTGSGTIPGFTPGPVTFTGTLFGGGTVTTTKTITPTNNTGTGWQQNITFTGTPLDNAVLTDLEFIAGGSVTTVEIDNINYVAVTTLPVIEITDAANAPISNGGTATVTNNTDFGAACTGGSVVKTFTIKNTGAVNLTLSGSPVAVLGGTSANQFSVTTQPAATVAANSSTTFTISYTPTAAGTHNATITLTSNDGTNSPYVINIKGSSAAAVTIGTQPVNQVLSGNGVNGAGNAVFTVSAGNATGYQWQIKNGATYNNLSNTAPYSGVTTNTLTVANPSVATLNNAVYRCVITGATPCAAVNSNDVSLTIISPGATLPSGTLTGTDINAGTDAGWTYYSLGGNVGFAIQWNGNATAKAGAIVSTTNGSATSATNASPQRAVYAMGRYWNVTSPALNPVVNIRFFFTASDKTAVTTNASNFAATNGSSNDGFRWFKTVGSAYSPANVTNSGITGNAIVLTGLETTINSVQQVEFSGIPSFSGGTGEASSGLGAVILPVNLLYFNADKWSGRSVNLTWATVSEKASAHFILERSTNGIDFTAIATVQSQGALNTRHDYQYVDGNPATGNNYYRLSEISQDGSITKFPIRVVYFDGKDALIKVYPNPAHGQDFYVDVTSGNDVSISLKTVTGQLINTTTIKQSNSVYKVEAGNTLTAGVYIVLVTTSAGKVEQRLIVK